MQHLSAKVLRHVATFCVLLLNSRISFFSGSDTLQASCVDGDIRLVNGSSPLEGRVEICMNNAWGTVCNNSFSSSDAEVVCTQLGYRFNGSSVLAPSEFFQGSGPIFLDRVSCEGGEERVLDCQQAPIGLHTCTHQQDTGVKCIGKRENLILCVVMFQWFTCEVLDTFYQQFSDQ